MERMSPNVRGSAFEAQSCPPPPSLVVVCLIALLTRNSERPPRNPSPVISPPSTQHLYIVRHGESEYNAATAAAGTGWDDPLIFDAPLTARGRAQACELRNTLAALGLPADVCWVTSPLQRAIETLVLACTGKERGVGGEVRLPSSLHIRRWVRGPSGARVY